MKNGKYQNKRPTKLVVLLLALVLLVGATVGGTIAWLISTPDPVTNTFTVGDIGKLTLTETDTDSTKDGIQHEYTIIPGVNIPKDPKVSYDYDDGKTGDFAVPVYIFVKIEAAGWIRSDDGKTYNIDEVTWSVDDAWTYLDNGVYYIAVGQNTDLNATSVIANDSITVPNTIEKVKVKTIADAAGTITFTAYAIQQATQANGTGTPAQAWAALNPANP